MTVSTTTNKVTYTGNGATTEFSYTFPILDADDLVVIITEDGVDTEVASATYSATGIGTYDGGAVTYPVSGTALTSSQQITILRRLSEVQDTDFTNQSTLYAESLETALDRIVMQVQQQSEKIARALVFSVSDSTDVTLPAATSRASKYLTFDENGDPAVTSAVVAGELTISAFWEATVALASAALSRTALGIGVTGTLGQAAADTILGNPTGSTADPTYDSLISHIARINNTRGALLRRGTSAWEALALGSDGQFLGSDGTDVKYIAPPIAEGMYRNLAIDATADTTVTVTADWITLANASNDIKLIRSVSGTIATGTSGANGLDTGAMATDTWYAVWVIHNPTSATTAVMLSTSATSPTMPSGYTYKHRVGWVRTAAASSALRRTRQRNAKGQYIYSASFILPTLASGSAITLLGASVPSTAVEIGVYAYIPTGSSAVTFAPNANYSNLDGPIYSNPATGSTRANIPAWFIIEGTAEVTLVSAGELRVFGWVDSL